MGRPTSERRPASIALLGLGLPESVQPVASEPERSDQAQAGFGGPFVWWRYPCATPAENKKGLQCCKPFICLVHLI